MAIRGILPGRANRRAAPAPGAGRDVSQKTKSPRSRSCAGFRRAPGADQIRLNTSVPLVPPKPKPFDTATSIFFSRATFGT